MALKFTIDPLAFPLDKTLHSLILKSKTDEVFVNISGVCVSFSIAVVKGYIDKGSASVSFSQFNLGFFRWLDSFSEVQVGAARRSSRLKLADSSHAALVRESSSASGREQKRKGRSHSDFTGSSSNRDRDESKRKERSENFSQAEADETAGAARYLDSTGAWRSRRFFDLSALQYPSPVKEVHVPVARGNYKGVTSKIVFGNDKGYLITGPTGCGKSTVALLELFLKPGTRVLVVEPTQANAANIYHEFKHILPTLVERIKARRVPSVSFVAPSVARPPFTQLMVTTTDKYLEYFEHTGRVFDVDYVVIDEFHLPIESMVKMVELVRTFELAKKYVLVSATAEGVKVEPALPPAVTCVTGRLEVGVIPRVVAGSDLDPRRWQSRGDGTVAVVAPSVAVAKELYSQYRSWGCDTYLITRETYVSAYVNAVSDYKPKISFVLEPGVEAGVTLSMAVLVSMGASTAIRYDGKVVVEDTQPLDPISAIQRGGRGGRVVPTLYVQPPPPDVDPPPSSAMYYRAQAQIWLRAFGADLKRRRADPIFKNFPRLANLSVKLAQACLDDGGDPFVAVYKHNSDGMVYTQCGGNGDGFLELAKGELFLYHWPGGFFVAPIANLANVDADPASFVVREHQLTAAQAMVDGIDGLSQRFTFDRLVDLVLQKLDIYVDDLFDVLKSVFSGSSATPFSVGDKAAEIADFVKESPEVTKLFEYLVTEPGQVKYTREESGSSRKMASHSFACGAKVLNFSFPPQYMDGSSLNVQKVSTEVFRLLNRVLAVEVLRNGAPERCVDLTAYAGRVQSNQKWYTGVVRRSLV